MIPRVHGVGIKETTATIEEVARRTGDQRPAWHSLKGFVLGIQQHWWDTGGEGSWGKEKHSTLLRDDRKDRTKRDFRMMIASGRLKFAATRATGNIKVGPTFLLQDLSSRAAYYALFQANQGHEPLGLPSETEMGHISGVVGDFILRSAGDLAGL